MNDTGNLYLHGIIDGDFESKPQGLFVVPSDMWRIIGREDVEDGSLIPLLDNRDETYGYDALGFLNSHEVDWMILIGPYGQRGDELFPPERGLVARVHDHVVGEVTFVERLAGPHDLDFCTYAGIGKKLPVIPVILPEERSHLDPREAIEKARHVLETILDTAGIPDYIRFIAEASHALLDIIAEFIRDTAIVSESLARRSFEWLQEFAKDILANPTVYARFTDFVMQLHEALSSIGTIFA